MQAQDSVMMDTLSQSYGEMWTADEFVESSNVFITFMYSNDLIFVVLGVTLIIWFVLLFFIFRVDKKLSKLEQEIQQTQNS